MTASATAAVVSSGSAEPFLKLSGLRKTYPGVVALADFSMEVRPGEVIGLVGENGAGKSTLMKILGGVIEPDRGTIEIDGVAHPVALGRAVDGGRHRLRPSGTQPVRQPERRRERLYRARTAGSTASCSWSTTTSCRRRCSLSSTGSARPSRRRRRWRGSRSPQQQIVEIAKALSLQSRLVILDEPTSSLPIAETEKLLEVIAGLKAHGIAVIFISHRLHEVVAGLRPRPRAARRQAGRHARRRRRSTTTRWSG